MQDLFWNRSHPLIAAADELMALVAEYERDMQTLFSVSQDAYAECIAAWERAGLI